MTKASDLKNIPSKYVPLVCRFSLESATCTSTMSKCAGMALDLLFAGTKGVARRQSTVFGNPADGFEGQIIVICL